MAPATLRSWVVGRDYQRSTGEGHFHPLIHPPVRQPPILSFWNLIEAHVLRAMRTEHGVSMDALRKALAYAHKTLNLKRLLLRYKPNELAAVIEHRVGLLVVIGKAPFPELARSFVATRHCIEAFLQEHEPPFIGKVYLPSASEIAKTVNAPGSVTLWYPSRQ